MSRIRSSGGSSASSVGAGAMLGVLQGKRPSDLLHELTVTVATIGQPLEVLKTYLAANRNDNLREAVRKTWQRGGVRGYYQGLWPWAVVEASTKGAILLVTSRQAESLVLKAVPGQVPVAGLVGGVVGGLSQAYLVMGLTTTMKTIEITRSKQAETVGGHRQSTFKIAQELYKREGFAGINKGVNAVALRQMTTWASRMGITRTSESVLRQVMGKGKDSPLSPGQKIFSSCIGGVLSCWNQPFEVLRIEMQSAAKNKASTTSSRPSMLETAAAIYRDNGPKGFFRGITPRLTLGASVTTFMVAGGDLFKSIS